MSEQPLLRGKLVDYTPIEEGWSLYRLDDGNFLRVKTTVVKIWRTDQKTPDGLPLYSFAATNACAVFTPQEMVSLRPKEKDVI